MNRSPACSKAAKRRCPGVPRRALCAAVLAAITVAGRALGAPAQTPPSSAAGAPSTASASSAPDTTAPSAAAEANLASTDAAARHATPRPTLYTDVQISGYELETGRISEALANELQVGLTTEPSTAAITLRVQAEAGKDVTVTYLPAHGNAISRSVRAPSRADEVPEVAALLAGNLARDESEQLLVDLAKARVAAAESEKPKTEPPPPAAPKDATEKPKAKPKPADEAKEPELGEAVFNFSVVHPISVLPNAHQLRLNAELGLFYSHVGGLRGVGINNAVLHVEQDVAGAMISGLVTLHGGPLTGANIAGLGTVAWGQRNDGVQIAGFGTYADGELHGAQLAGLLALESEAVYGAQIAGLLSAANGPVHGFQIASVNLSQSEVNGVQLGGGLNYAETAHGAQVAGLLNVAPVSATGLQLSLLNISGDLSGAQLGIVNVGGDVEGVQVGLVNVARSVKGASVGLVTYSQEGKTQLVTWASSNQPLNLGVRFYTGPLYAMPSVGYDPGHPSRFEPSAHLGGRADLGRLYVDLDGQYTQRIESNTDPEFIQVRYRTLVGFEIAPWLAVFAGGGVKHDLHTGTNFSQSFGPDFAGGVELF